MYFDNVITCDESWAYHYDPKTKQQSTLWVTKGSAPPKKVRAQKSQLKIIVLRLGRGRATYLKVTKIL